jgi:hypothetical protein
MSHASQKQVPEALKYYLKYLLAQPATLLNEGIINLYLCLVNLASRHHSVSAAQTDPPKQVQPGGGAGMLKAIIKALTPLLLYYLVNKECISRTKSHNYTRAPYSRVRSEQVISAEDHGAEDREKLLNSIEAEFSGVPLGKLVGQHLREVENEIIDSVEICRLCSQ